MRVDRIAYGSGEFQYGDLTMPLGDGPHPVLVFIHGGFWRNVYSSSLADPQAEAAAAAGHAAWNIEYRRMGDEGGGYPGTLADVASAVDHLAVLAPLHGLDLDRVVVVGHSAGDHLALWAGQRGRLPEGAEGSDPAVVPRLVVGQAPVADLGAGQDLGSGAVVAFMGGNPLVRPDAYALADPVRLLPLVVPQLILHGTDDTNVPCQRSLDYAELVADPTMLEVRIFDGADHFDVIDPTHRAGLVTILNREAGPQS